MKRGNIQVMWHVLNDPVFATMENKMKFSYGIAKNLRIIKPEMEALDFALKASKDYQAYEKDRIALAEELSVKNDRGKPTKDKNGNILLGNSEEFSERLKELRDVKHKDAWLKHTAMLEEDVPIEFYKISVSDFPEKISAALMEILVEFIDEKTN